MARQMLGIIGSPRKHGNCELFIKAVYTSFPDDWELALVRLPDWDIRPCKACYQCLFGEMGCPQRDAFNELLDVLTGCDAYMVAAPTYLLAANASLKAFLDRGLSFYGKLDRMWGKPAAGVAIAGIAGMEGCTKLNVESFVKLTFGDLRSSAVVYGALPGEIFLNLATRETAHRIAQSLLHGPAPTDADGPRCPVCGGDTFKFLPDGGIHCMLCSSLGRWRFSEGRLVLHTEPGEHAFIITKESAREHADWLRQMKDRFMESRQSLKEVSRAYTTIGSWIRPSGSSAERRQS
jgi:multimeric flavodoxin WrbA